MPSFEQLILSAPHGFPSSCLAVNKLASVSESDFEVAVVDSWSHAVKKTSLSAQHSREKKAIAFIIRSMKAAQPAPTISNTANALLNKSLLTQETIEKILLKVKELSGTESEAELTTKTSGKLMNFQWRIGVAISSNSCKNLFSPYVLISYDVANDNGKTTKFSAELSYEQFVEMKTSFEKMAAVMDVV